jgi:hypothetical protein
MHVLFHSFLVYSRIVDGKGEGSKGISNGPTFWPQSVADLDRLRRAADMNGALSSPLTVCVGTASSRPTHFFNFFYYKNILH